VVESSELGDVARLLRLTALDDLKTQKIKIDILATIDYNRLNYYRLEKS
jgi:hypothetical protein